MGDVLDASAARIVYKQEPVKHIEDCVYFPGQRLESDTQWVQHRIFFSLSLNESQEMMTSGHARPS